MNKVENRHAIPVAVPRRGGMRLIEGQSQKLQRRIRVFSYASYAIWIGLEAEPTVEAFCECPVRIGDKPSDPVVDFWVKGSDREEYLVSPDRGQDVHWPGEVNGISLRKITGADIVAASQWVKNWEFILAALNAQEPVSDAHGVVREIEATVQRPMTLAEIERQHSKNGTPVVRACVFHLLRKGKLTAPSLRNQRLSNVTIFEPS